MAQGRMAKKKQTSEHIREAPGLFGKRQLLASKRYRNRRDLLDALLDENKMYTMKAVEEEINKYMKGQVR